MEKTIEIIATTRIVTDDGGLEPVGEVNAEAIVESLREAGYKIIPSAEVRTETAAPRR